MNIFHQLVINIVDDISVKDLKRHLFLNITNFISGLKTLKYWLVEIFIYYHHSPQNKNKNKKQKLSKK